MKNYRLIALFLLIFVALIELCSCGGSGGEGEKKNLPTKTLNVYNWGEYISDEDDEECGLFDVNSAFEEYFNEHLAEKYGYYVKVNYSTYATNEDMYAKITNSAVAYDIVIPSDYMIQKMIGEGLLNPIDHSKLSNYGNISESFKGMYYDPDDAYSVPYTYGMLGVIYNSEFVSEEDIAEESWSLLWNEKYKGKILQFNNPRDAFGTAMYWKNLDVNSKDPAVWNQALDMLKEQKPLLQGYVNDEIFNKMKGASAYIAPYFAGDFLTMAAENEDLNFYYPKEGTNYFVDAMCIPKTSKNTDLAHAYIDYMISVEAATANALYIGYASPNKAVTDSEYYKEMLSYNYDTDFVDAWEVLYSKDKTEANESYSYNPAYNSYYKDEQVDIQVHVNSLWEELKTENATELWVHITSITIVVVVLTAAIYDIYIKKKRSRDYRLRDKANKKKA
ncbi:MAG: spermidine/putrescine ABC transporter substrate-binding protein [Clostridia bacterium]|nr:spermidine/putrescine ABC transporter substrate-binding protein [Clostridia bacterium]